MRPRNRDVNEALSRIFDRDARRVARRHVKSRPPVHWDWVPGELSPLPNSLWYTDRNLQKGC